MDRNRSASEEVEQILESNTEVFEAKNWNNAEDDMDKQIWDRLISQFWIDTRIPVSNDIPSWAKFTEEEKWLTLRVFTGLTLLDTLQGEFGAPSLVPDAITAIEKSWLANIAFMEEVHAKSYSTIFQTLASTREINEAFRWSRESETLQNKARIVKNYYTMDNDKDHLAPLKRKVASTLLESFLFYSGFFLPIWFDTRQKLTNTADLIKLIIQDEAVHGFAIGYKFQQGFNQLSAEDKEYLTDWSYDLLEELYDNELRYTEDLYDGVFEEYHLTEKVKEFLRYNANKALQNLGFDSLFSDVEPDPAIIASLSMGQETHDFFSRTGAYVVGNIEETADDDWDWESDDWTKGI